MVIEPLEGGIDERVGGVAVRTLGTQDACRARASVARYSVIRGGEGFVELVGVEI